MGLASRIHPALFCSPDVYVRAGQCELRELGECAIALTATDARAISTKSCKMRKICFSNWLNLRNLRNLWIDF
jgi:hypothetical protein